MRVSQRGDGGWGGWGRWVRVRRHRGGSVEMTLANAVLNDRGGGGCSGSVVELSISRCASSVVSFSSSFFRLYGSDHAEETEVERHFSERRR